jgi:tetratricopeptide (TPR) repeat protein
MTVSEISQLYERIIDHIRYARLKEAFSGLGFLLQQNGFGKAYDKLNETENKYRYMLKYRLEGFPDPDFDKSSFGIRRQLMGLAEEALHAWMTRNSPAYYYDRIRVQKIGSLDTLSGLIELMRTVGEKSTLVELVESEDRQVKRYQLLRSRENAAGQVFLKILVSEPWTDEEQTYLTYVFQDPVIFGYEKALFVSALLLSLQMRFDVRKILFLMEMCNHTEGEVSQRSLVALVLTLYAYDSRLFLYPEIGIKLNALLEESPGLDESFVRVFYQCIRAKDTEQVTKRMQEEILPEMNKMGSAIQEKLREGEDLSDELNPDWQNMMENSEFSIKMQQFSDMQLEGIDVYMGTFSMQKAYTFFLDFHNWFLPFHTSNSGLQELFKDERPEGKSVLDAVLNSDFLCSSDKYSFCFNLLQVPASYRSSMSSQINAESEAYEEIKKSRLGINSKYRLEQISNRYIQDLYRFFRLHNRRKDFQDPFASSLDFHRTSVLGSLMQGEEALRRIGLFYFKNKHFPEALDLIDRLLELIPEDSELHQKRGYCLQQLQQPEAALQAFMKAELIRPDSLWVLKRIGGLYRQLKQPVKAMSYYQKAASMSVDDFQLTMNIGHSYFEAGNYVEALNQYFKAELISDGSSKTWKPLAWCLFICRKYDHAAKYYAKILGGNPTLEDYLNAGHVEWCQGRPAKAVEFYKKGIRLTHTILPEFLELFRKDYTELKRHGIAESEISVLRDELLYELEE